MRLIICGAAVLLGVVGPTEANPVVEHVFSELTFDVIDWRLEMTPWEELSTWFLTTMSDTAEFRPDVPLEDYLVVTQDDLLRPLHIDPQGDTLRIWKPEWFPNLPVDELIFGTVEGAFIASPSPGYSISTSPTFFYLDASPTMGAANDTLNAKGNIHGIVTDSLGTPMQGVRVVYDYDMLGNPVFATTAETGEFLIHEYARLVYLMLEAEGCPAALATAQIWPDTTVEMSIALDCEMGADPWEGPSYHLLATQPNPFASGTSFLYALPTPADVRIAVYNTRGALVKVLFDGRQSEGRHTLIWDASGMPSGAYVCRLTTPRATLTARCILAR